MNKTKKRNIIISCILVFALLIAAAFAFLTATDTKQNVFTVGDVDIELWEKFDGETYGPDDGNPPVLENIAVDGLYEKAPYIKNVGNSGAYTFMTVGLPVIDAVTADESGNILGNGKPVETEMFVLVDKNGNNGINDGWIKESGPISITDSNGQRWNYYLYRTENIVAEDETTEELFSQIAVANIVNTKENSEFNETEELFRFPTKKINATSLKEFGIENAETPMPYLYVYGDNVIMVNPLMGLDVTMMLTAVNEVSEYSLNSFIETHGNDSNLYADYVYALLTNRFNYLGLDALNLNFEEIDKTNFNSREILASDMMNDICNKMKEVGLTTLSQESVRTLFSTLGESEQETVAATLDMLYFSSIYSAVATLADVTYIENQNQINVYNKNIHDLTASGDGRAVTISSVTPLKRQYDLPINAYAIQSMNGLTENYVDFFDANFGTAIPVDYSDTNEETYAKIAKQYLFSGENTVVGEEEDDPGESGEDTPETHYVVYSTLEEALPFDHATDISQFESFQANHYYGINDETGKIASMTFKYVKLMDRALSDSEKMAIMVNKDTADVVNPDNDRTVFPKQMTFFATSEATASRCGLTVLQMGGMGFESESQIGIYAIDQKRTVGHGVTLEPGLYALICEYKEGNNPAQILTFKYTAEKVKNFKLVYSLEKAGEFETINVLDMPLIKLPIEWLEDLYYKDEYGSYFKYQDITAFYEEWMADARSSSEEFTFNEWYLERFGEIFFGGNFVDEIVDTYGAGMLSYGTYHNDFYTTIGLILNGDKIGAFQVPIPIVNESATLSIKQDKSGTISASLFAGKATFENVSFAISNGSNGEHYRLYYSSDKRVGSLEWDESDVIAFDDNGNIYDKYYCPADVTYTKRNSGFVRYETYYYFDEEQGKYLMAEYDGYDFISYNGTGETYVEGKQMYDRTIGKYECCTDELSEDAMVFTEYKESYYYSSSDYFYYDAANDCYIPTQSVNNQRPYSPDGIIYTYRGIWLLGGKVNLTGGEACIALLPADFELYMEDDG